MQMIQYDFVKLVRESMNYDKHKSDTDIASGERSWKSDNFLNIDDTTNTVQTDTDAGPMIMPSHYVPTEFDVVCGRGRGLYHSPGNMKFRAIVQNYLDEYEALQTKIDKSALVNQIIDKVLCQNRGNVRFVRKVSLSPVTWVQLEYNLVRDKVGHAIREALTTRKKKNDDFVPLPTLYNNEIVSCLERDISELHEAFVDLLEPVPIVLNSAKTIGDSHHTNLHRESAASFLQQYFYENRESGNPDEVRNAVASLNNGDGSYSLQQYCQNESSTNVNFQLLFPIGEYSQNYNNVQIPNSTMFYENAHVTNRFEVPSSNGMLASHSTIHDDAFYHQHTDFANVCTRSLHDYTFSATKNDFTELRMTECSGSNHVSNETERVPTIDIDNIVDGTTDIQSFPTDLDTIFK